MAADCSAIEIEDGGSETCWGAARAVLRKLFWAGCVL